MQSIGAFEAKTHFSALLEEVEKGKEMLITKHGKPVAKLSPVGFSKTNLKKTVESLQAFQSIRKLELGLNWKILRDEGRK